MRKFPILKKILPSSFTLNTAQKPMHSGEVFYLWEGLTSSYRIISISETYIMNTKDKDLQLFLQGLIKGVQILRIPKLEKLLKDAGFTVPPRPSSKTLQGKPGVGQKVRLSDEEVIRVLLTLSHALVNLDGRAVGSATTNDAIRELFIELLNNSIRAHDALLLFGNSRQAFSQPPPATATPNGLNAGEIYWLWDQMLIRNSRVILLEWYLANATDADLKTELEYGLFKIALPRLKRLEDVLKNEGYTIPPRPVNRLNQQTGNKVSKIVLRDNEILSIVMTASQVFLTHHIRAFTASVRSDVRTIFKDFIKGEITHLERLIKLANKRNILENPPNVTTYQV